MAQAAQRLARAVAAKGPPLLSGAVSWGRPRLATVWRYARVELAPPTPADFPRAAESLRALARAFQDGRLRHLPVKEALRNGLVATEVLLWFYIGEILGKRGLIGYDV